MKKKEEETHISENQKEKELLLPAKDDLSRRILKKIFFWHQKNTEKEVPLPGREKFFLYAAFLLPLCLLIFLRMLCTQIHGGEPGTDGFYHAAMALAGPEVFAAKKFPALVLSIWQDSFADKELFYHFLLMILFHIRQFFTGTSFPFTFPAMTFAAAALLSFTVLLKVLKIPAALIFLSSLLFSFCSYAFTYRFLMLRPHVFSITFMLLCCVILAKGSLKNKSVFLFLLSFLYAWSYSNPHFLLIPILFYAVFAKKKFGKKSFLLLLSAFAGLFAGYLIHPQVPNTFYIWKVQSIDALFNPILYGNIFTPRLIPMEMLPGNFMWYRNMLPFYFLCYLSLFFFVRLKEKSSREKREIFSPAEKTILLLALLFTIATFAVLRAVEYAVPFGTGAFAILLKYSIQERTAFFQNPFSHRKILLILFAAALTLALLNTNLMLKSNFKNRPPDGPAKWLKENTPENSLVINLDWGDFPAMFYVNRHNAFLWGLDPAFSYAYAPKKARQLENCVLNSIRRKKEDSRIHALTGAKYAFVLSRREKFITYLKDCSWKPVYESEEGCIFLLDSSAGTEKK